jgi:hypothetical protein
MGDVVTKAEQRRQDLLEAKAACRDCMSHKAREFFERDPDPVESQAENARTGRLNEATNALRHIRRRAMSCGDLANAVRAVRELIRIEQLERQGRSDLEQQRARMDALPPGGIPLPGMPGEPPITEQGKMALQEIEKLSPADRALLREGYTAALRISQLEARKGRMSDLLRDHSLEQNMQGPDHGPQEASGKGKEGQDL